MAPEDRGAPSLDMDPATFRAAAHAVVDVMADYLEGVGSRAVFPPIEPGCFSIIRSIRVRSGFVD